MVKIVPKKRSRTGPSDVERLAARIRVLEKAPGCPFALSGLSELIEEIANRQEAILAHYEGVRERSEQSAYKKVHAQIFGPGGSIERVRKEAREAALKERYDDLFLMAGQEGYRAGYHAGSGAAKAAKERNEPVPPPPPPPQFGIPGRLRCE